MADRSKSEETRAAMEERKVEAEMRMEKSIEALHKDLQTIRTGRATPALVEHLSVDYYGSPTPLQSIAGVSAPEARTLLIQPYDRNAIADIEKALQKSDLGLNPNNDGQVIRINIPALTEDRRKDMVKVVHRKGEDARVAIRNIRRDEVDHLRKVEKEGHVSKDEIESLIGDMQKVTDRHVALVDDVCVRKEAEILEV